MQSIVVITPPNITLKDFVGKLEQYYDVDIVSEDRIVINSGDRYIAINLDDYITEEYDEQELNRISQFIKQPQFFLIEFSHLDFLKEVLPFCVDENGFLIDNDHGDILSGREFLLKLRQNPRWDWRITVDWRAMPALCNQSAHHVARVGTAPYTSS